MTSRAAWWALAPALAGLGGCSGPPAPPEHPNVVLVVLDTVRRDHTGVARDAGSRTPFFDRWANEATRFPNTWSVAPWTVPSHASIFTGALPSAHGCSMRDFRFDTGLPSLAQILTGEGYRSGAFFANPWLSDDATGLLRGFSVRRESPFGGFLNRPGGRDGYQGGRAVLAGVRDWLRSRPAEEPPFFLFVSFLEAHLPYDPPPDHRAEFLADLPPGDRVSIEWGMEFNAGLHAPDTVDWDRVRRLYGGDVHTADRLFADLLELLRAEELYQDTVVIVASDHGENLGDHGLIDHQFSLHETLLAVPLVIRAPGRIDPGVREDPVMLTDLYATVLELAGVEHEPPPPYSRSLVAPPPPPAPGTPQDAGRPLFAEYAGPHRSLVDLLRASNPELAVESRATAYRSVRLAGLRLTVGDDGSVALHDLASDPEQTRNLATERAEVAAALREMLDEAVPEPGAPPTDAPALDEQTREKLRSLGYVD